MAMNWIYVLGTILCAYVNYSIQQHTAPVPCPNMFAYHHDGTEWYGIAHIRALPVGQRTETEIVLSLLAPLPSQYAGVLELYGSREAADQQISSNQPVVYRVRFPLQSPLPKLTQISVNGNVLCSGPPETGVYVTTIELKHILYTVFPHEQQPVNSYNYINQQQPFTIYYGHDIQYPQQSYQSPQQSYQFPQQSYQSPQQSYQSPTQSYQSPSPPIQTYQPQDQFIQPQIQYSLPTHQPYNSQQYYSDVSDQLYGPYQVESFILSGVKAKQDLPKLVVVNLKLATGLDFICGGHLMTNLVVVTPDNCYRTGEGYSPADVLSLIHNNQNATS